MANLTRGLAMVAAFAVAALAPAAAHAATCSDPPTARTFLPWLDPAFYEAPGNGDLEQGAQGWTLDGDAATVQGNESYYVGGAQDHRSLALPAGSAATTPAVCISVDHPTVRFFARNNGSPASLLAVSVVFRGLDGSLMSLPIGAITGGPVWAPMPVMPVAVNLLSLLGSQSVSFRLAPIGTGGDWQIDDIYVDPYGKR